MEQSDHPRWSPEEIAARYEIAAEVKAELDMQQFADRTGTELAGVVQLIDWQDASEGPNSLRGAWIGDYYYAIVSDDDEGPMSPAFYWRVENYYTQKIDEGWAGSVEQAEKDAVQAARTASRRWYEHDC